MPYTTNSDLPLGVRGHLPPQGQDIYRATFNNAWRHYAYHLDRREEISRRVAWTAVKRFYQKSGDQWVPRDFSVHSPAAAA
jgi:cation transport regulator